MRGGWQVPLAVALAAALSATAAWLEVGATRGVPAIAGAGGVALAVVYLRTRRPLAAALAGLLAALGALAVDWFLLFVLGAGHLELREFRRDMAYPVLFVLLFAVPALTDARRLRGGPGGA